MIPFTGVGLSQAQKDRDGHFNRWRKSRPANPRYPSVSREQGYRWAAWILLCLAIAVGRHVLGKTIEVLANDPVAVNLAKLEGAAAGDEVLVAPGTYRFRVFLDRHGTAQQPIIIRAREADNRPVWDLQGKPVAEWIGSSQRSDRGRSIWQISGSHYRLSGIVFRNGTDGRAGDSGGLRFISSGPVTVRDCLFQFNDNGIQGASSDLLVESC
jgi:hypothetical protein